MNSLTPYETFVDFFEWYSLEHSQTELWQWLQQVLSCDLSDMKDHLKRSDLLFFHEKLKGVLTAAHHLSQDTSFAPDVA